MKTYLFAGIATAAMIGGMSGAAAAETKSAQVFGIDNVTVTAGLGYSSIRANELVYDDDGSRISHLIWQSKIPVATLGIKADLGNGWTLSGNAAIKAGDNGKMRDLDWLELSPSKAWNDWSHRSQHPNSPLHSYVNLDVALGRNYQINDTTVTNIHGGIQYTNAGWSSYGGSYIYSDKAFRDDTGNFPDKERGISYKQSHTGIFIGSEVTTKIDNWTLAGMARVGVSINSKDVDHHWSRDLRFDGDFKESVFMVLGGRAEYAFNEKTSLIASAQYQQFQRAKGDVNIQKIGNGAFVEQSKNGGGADLKAMTVGLAIQTRF